MDKLIHKMEKELCELGEREITSAELEAVSKIVDTVKDLYEIKEKKEEGNSMRDYRDSYQGYDYRDGGRMYNNYGRRGVPGSGRYRDHDRFRDHMEDIMECMEMYEYDKARYRAGGSEERMYDGIDKLMHSICMFVEAAMDFAETPQEKEIIRDHVQKMKQM